MRADEQWLSDMVDGHLPDDQADQYIESMLQDPELMLDAQLDLEISDNIARALDPSRSDAAFIEQLTTLIDNGFDSGEDGDGGDHDGDLPDTDGPTIDGSPTSSGTGAGSGLSTGAKVWTSIILAGTIAGGAAVVYTLSDNTSPEPPTAPEAIVIVDPPNANQLDFVADADVDLHEDKEYKKGEERTGSLLQIHSTPNITACRTYIRFDLTALPQDFERAELRLFPVMVDEGMAPINMKVTRDDPWEEESISLTNGPRPAPSLMAEWRPEEGKHNVFDVTELVRHRRKRQKTLTFTMRVHGHYETKHTGIASREHENPSLRPVIRVTLKQGTESPK